MKTRNDSSAIAQYLKHGLLCYAPALLPLLILLPAFALNLLIAVSEGEPALVWAALYVGSLLLPAFLIWLSFTLCQKLQRVLERFGVLYAVWCILLVGALFILNSAVAGVSQAAVEGSTGSAALRQSALGETASTFLLLHLFFVPWICFALYRMSKQDSRQP